MCTRAILDLMRASLSLIPVLSAIFACGPGEPAATDTDPGTTATTGNSTTTSTTTATPTTTTTAPTTTTEPIDSTGSTTGEPTTGGTSTTTTATSNTSTGDTSTGEPVNIAHAGQFWAGGLDHLDVRKADFDADLCIRVGFARPGGAPSPGLELPLDWWLQSAGISHGAAACFDFDAPQPDFIEAEQVTGTGAWDVRPFCPPTVDLDITLTFPQDQPQFPAEAIIFAAGIPIEGC